MTRPQRIIVRVVEGDTKLAIEKGAEMRLTAGDVVTVDAGKPVRETQLTNADGKRIAAALAAARPAQGLGQLVVKDAQSDSPVRLNIARYHAHVVLQPPVALVQIDQTFYNPYGHQEEGTFVFNLPRGALVSRFAMYIAGGSLVEGELIERQRASEVYETIVRQQRDPAILEQIGDNLFKMRVFPIFPLTTKQILLDYTVPLEATAGECHFRLPLLSDLQPVGDFEIKGAIVAIQPGSAASQSHPGLVFRPARDDRVTFALQQENYRPQTDFALSFREQAGKTATFAATWPSRRRRRLPGGIQDAAADAEAWLYFRAEVEPGRRAAAGCHAAPGRRADSGRRLVGHRGCTLVRQAVRMVARESPPPGPLSRDGRRRDSPAGPRRLVRRRQTPGGRRLGQLRPGVLPGWDRPGREFREGLEKF